MHAAISRYTTAHVRIPNKTFEMPVSLGTQLTVVPCCQFKRNFVSRVRILTGK